VTIISTNWRCVWCWPHTHVACRQTVTAVRFRDVMEPTNIRIHWMRISCAKSVGFGCRYITRSKLPPISLLWLL